MSRLKSVNSAAVLSAAIVLGQNPFPASATEFTAKVMMEKMDAGSRVTLIQGIIDGLAYSRFLHDNEHAVGDKRDETGMTCIYDWYLKKKNSHDMIYEAFDKFPDYPPVAIINSLIKQDCGA